MATWRSGASISTAQDWYKKFEGKQNKWSDVINWPTTQYPRVIRGGSWNSEAEDCRSAARVGSDKEMNKKDPQLPKSPHWMSDGFWIGFRVVAPINEPSEADRNKYWDVDDPVTKRVIERDREIREIIAPKK